MASDRPLARPSTVFERPPGNVYSVPELFLYSVDDVQSLIDRSLLPGEAEAIRKSLDSALQEVLEDAVYAVTDAAEFEEVRASELEEQDVFREYGLDEYVTIDKLDQHGDTVLITATNGDESSLDIDEVVERWKNKPVKSEEDTA